MKKCFSFLIVCCFLFVCVVPFCWALPLDPWKFDGLTSDQVAEEFNIDVSSPWCARFASAVSSLSGYNVPSSASCTECFRWFKLRSRISNVPLIDNWIFFDWEMDGVIDHVGIVISNDSYLEVLSGNVENKVAIQKFDISDSRIYAFADPRSDSKTVSVQALAPVTPSNTNGFKKVLVQLIGNYDPIVEEYSYTSSQGYTSYVREIQPDYIWMISAAFILLFFYMLLRWGAGLFWKR